MQFNKELPKTSITVSLALLVFAGLLLLSTAGYGQEAIQKRPLLPGDADEREAVAGSTFSPDGRLYVYGRRAPQAASIAKFGHRDGTLATDLWLVETSGGVPKRILPGSSTGTSYLRMVWSPDGRRLAVIASRKHHFRVEVWDRSTGSSTAVTPLYTIRYPLAAELAWVSNTRLLVTTPPQSAEPLYPDVPLPMQPLLRGWSAQAKGLVSAQVVESGIGRNHFADAIGQLVLADVVAKTCRVLAKGDFREFLVSPDHGVVAVLRNRETYLPHAGERVPYSSGWPPKVGLAILPIGEERSPKPLALDDVIWGSLAWSPDGSQLAFLGKAENADSPYGVHVWQRKDNSFRSVHSIGKKRPFSGSAPIIWSGNGRVYTTLSEREASPGPRNDWLEVGSAQSITASLKAVPVRLIPAPNGDFVGVSGGKLWRVFPDGKPAVELGAATISFSAVQFPTQAEVHNRRGAGFDKVVVTARDGNTSAWYLVNLRDGAMRSISRPDPEALPLQFVPDTEMLSSLSVSRRGDTLFLSNVQRGEHRRLCEMNGFKHQFLFGETSVISYRSLDGKSLQAGLLLPVNYDKNKRYPLIVFVYPGDIVTSFRSLPDGWFLNLQFLSSRGYAVVQPSMPLPPAEEPMDVLPTLRSGVDPAIDKLVEMGIADASRIGIMGHSFGGYGTVGLISQSRRYKAAVALSGVYNLFSYYGTFVQPRRYGSAPQEDLYHVAWAESGQSRLGVPPWSNPERYIRNSPLLQVEKVETPLLLVHGDQDATSIEQSEEMFTALYRLNKRAKLIRYLGEDHTIITPENIKHLWKQIYDWFGTWLQPAAPVPSNAAIR